MHSVNETLEHAKKFCIERKERLTKPRIEVLKIIAESEKPLGAYEVLERLGKVLDTPKPPTAYRSIDFWVKAGFIHRIESLNAYIICDIEHHHQGVQFMICNDCGKVTETHICKLAEALSESIQESIFALSSWKVEMRGLCQQCQQT